MSPAFAGFPALSPNPQLALCYRYVVGYAGWLTGYPQHRQERFLRNIHALLAFLLLLQQLALARDVAAVARRQPPLGGGRRLVVTS